MSKGNNTSMILEHEEIHVKLGMGAFKYEHIDENVAYVGTHNTRVINQDFFIEYLSDFSHEDLSAPIFKSDDNYSPASQQHSDENSASTIKSDSTTTISSPASVVLLEDLLEDSALDLKANSLANEFQDSSLSLPDEMGFDWLTSLGDDNLVCDASNFGMDSFLLSNNVEPFVVFDGMPKHSEYEDAMKVKDMEMEQISLSATSTLDYGQNGQESRIWNTDVNGKKSNNAASCVSHSTGSRSARRKRARSSGWSSSSILLHHWPVTESPSPTDSLNSTSKILIPTGPRYGSTPSFTYKQAHGYTHGNMEINFTSRLISAVPNGDKPLHDSNMVSNVGSIEQWPKKEDMNSRDESVSNYNGGMQPRRCTHCLSQKTPQWRAGPDGPKTLCNACGVRYKSGRLFDEYRPAKSPTFLSFKHSNSHKKVMEMRRRKSFHYNQQQPPYDAHAVHHMRAASVAKHVDVGNQHLMISKVKVKLNNPTHTEIPSTQFSDVTLISTRNAIESPSTFLY